MIPENEKSSLRARLHAKMQNDGIEETELQKVELISKYLSDLQVELAKFDSPETLADKHFGYLG